MDETCWVQQAVGRFFHGRKSPTQEQCDQIARSVSGAPNVYNVGTPGSMSYTVICKHDDIPTSEKPVVVVSFREPEAHIDQTLSELAQTIHGNHLVPQVSQRGVVDGSEPPLSIYAMSYLPGISCLDAGPCQVEMDEATEAKYVVFVRHLGRYFARCWSNPQISTTLEDTARSENLKKIQRRLVVLKASLSSSSWSFPLSTSELSELELCLSVLFAQEYPQVLTHGDLSLTNVLVDENTHEITGIVDWSLASIFPFGLELDTLYLTTGYMDLGGWHDYSCRERLHQSFWNEFWSVSGIGDDEDKNKGRRKRIRDMAEKAAKIGAILRYAFRRNADGSPSEELVSEGKSSSARYLRAWLTPSL